MSVLRSAKRLRVEPACSYAIQKTTAASEEDRDHHQPLPLLGASIRRRRNSQAKKPTVMASSTHLKLREIASGSSATSPLEHQHDADHHARRAVIRPTSRTWRSTLRRGRRIARPDRMQSVGREVLAAQRCTASARRNIPTAAAPKPQCQEVSGRDARPRRASA